MFLNKYIQNFFPEKKYHKKLLLIIITVIFFFFLVFIFQIRKGKSRKLLEPKKTSLNSQVQDHKQVLKSSEKDDSNQIKYKLPSLDKTINKSPSKISNETNLINTLSEDQESNDQSDKQNNKRIWPEVEIKEPTSKEEFYYGIDFKVKIDVSNYQELKQVRYYLDDRQVFEIQDFSSQTESSSDISKINQSEETLSLETIFDSEKIIGFLNEDISLDFYVNLVTWDDFVVQSEKIPVTIKPNQLTIKDLQEKQEFSPQDRLKAQVVFDNDDFVQKIDFFINEEIYLYSDKSSPFELDFDLQKIYAGITATVEDTLNIQVHDIDDNIQNVKNIDFVVTPPLARISSMEPEVVNYGDLVTVKGQGFGLKPAQIRFFQNGQLAQENSQALSLLEWTDEKIQVYLNEKIQTGEFQVQVVNQYQQESNFKKITINYGQARISTIDFMRDEEPIYMNILGESFAEQIGAVYFLKNNDESVLEAEIRQWGNTSIMCDLPSNLQADSDYYVYVVTADSRRSPAVKLKFN